MHSNEQKTKNIWITGASRGIGLSIAQALQFTGNNIILCARTPLKEAIAKGYIDGTMFDNPKLYYLEMDMSDTNSIDSVYNRIVSNLGKVDILINNAAVANFAPFSKLELEDFDKMININLRGSFYTTRLVINSMIESQSGMVLNIQSVAAKKVFKHSSIYSASKSGFAAMSAVLREEVRSKGVKVVDVFPGATLTDIWGTEQQEKYKNEMMHSIDVADVVFDVISKYENNRLMIEEIVLKPQHGDL